MTKFQWRGVRRTGKQIEGSPLRPYTTTVVPNVPIITFVGCPDDTVTFLFSTNIENRPVPSHVALSFYKRLIPL
jgi:hypothetical protein